VNILIGPLFVNLRHRLATVFRHENINMTLQGHSRSPAIRI